MDINEIYDSSFICTYKIHDDDDMYRSQFLQAFKLIEWNDKFITIKTDSLFNIVETYFIKIFDELRTEKTRFTHMMLFMGEHLTNENLFRILFVYDLFDLTHRCICDILNNNKLSEDLLNKLLIGLRSKSL